MAKQLFHSSDLSKPVPDKMDMTFNVNYPPERLIQVNEKASAFLNCIKEELEPNTHIDFVTAGELSLHQIIQYFSLKFGSVNVYVSSWAIKEEPARVLLSLRQNGTIKQLFGVFDYRIKTLDAKHFQLIESAFTKYALTKNHSKVVIIESNELSMVVVSSANLSNNPRIECGFISTITKTVDFHKAWMTAVLNGKKVY